MYVHMHVPLLPPLAFAVLTTSRCAINQPTHLFECGLLFVAGIGFQCSCSVLHSGRTGLTTSFLCTYKHTDSHISVVIEAEWVFV